ncbi:MAG: ATP-binding protein [candidate division WOR-3 bacterium]
MLPIYMYEFLKRLGFQENHEIIKREMDRLLILQNIIDGKIILNNRKINLFDFMNNFLEREKEDGIVFDLNLYSPPQTLEITTDSNYFDIILKELIDNSKISISKSGLIKININKRNYNILEIIDSGTGIPKSDIKKIFTPFFVTNFHLFKGHLGIGLSIVSGLLKFMGAKIEINSEYSKGTKVTLYLI